jgi:galactokinase
VKKSIGAGCIGARLTGAGWGGCCVVLVEKSKRDEIAGKLDVLFWTEPSSGIEIVYSGV